MLNKDKLFSLFHKVVYIKYNKVENDASYAIEKSNGLLQIYFQCSYESGDWINNLDFPAIPYSDMGISWKCHRGFLRVWKSIEPYLRDAVLDTTVQRIEIIGYSQGAAIAALAHEYVWYHRPDLRKNLITYAFGTPRCFWGFFVPAKLVERWENYYVFDNKKDIIQHLPPRIFGFCDLGTKTIIDSGCENYFISHSPEEYEKAIKNINI